MARLQCPYCPQLRYYPYGITRHIRAEHPDKMDDNGSNGLNELDRCNTCQHTRLWHDNNQPMHPFNDGQAGATAFLGPKKADGGTTPANAPKVAHGGSQTAGWPIDPVLRVALINKGILTPEDLRAAEETIRLTTTAFEQQVAESRGESQ